MVGKWYYVGTYQFGQQVKDNAEFPDLYYYIAEISSKNGRFSEETHLNGHLIRHQVIVARETDFTNSVGEVVLYNYKDQNKGEFVRAIDLNDAFQFSTDSPDYFFNYDFPYENQGRNYFVRYTNRQ